MLALQEQAVAERRLQLEEEAKKGLGGKRLGKHVVPEGDIDVQLGEDLTESLRGLKVRVFPLCIDGYLTDYLNSLREICSKTDS